MANLYELTKCYQDIQEQDLDQEQLQEALNAVEGLFEEKADSIAMVMRSIGCDIDAIKQEEQRLADRRKSLENKSESLKQYLQDNMQSLGKEKFKTTLFSFGIQNNPPSVKIINEELLKEYEGYWIEQEPKLDKKSLLEDLKKNDEQAALLNGIAEIQQTRSLRIK